MIGSPLLTGATLMTAFQRRRTTPVALLILVGGAGGLFYSQTVASENGNTTLLSRRTAAGLQNAEQAYEANLSVQPPRGLRDRSNRTPFIAQKAAPPIVVPRTFVPEPASSAPQLLTVDAQPLSPMRSGPTSANSESTVAPTGAGAEETTELPIVQDLVVLQPSAEPPAPRRTEPAESSTQRNAPPPIIDPAPASELPAPITTEAQPMFAPLQLSGINRATTSIATPKGEVPLNLAERAMPGAPQPLAPPDEAIHVTAPFYSTPRVPDFTHRPLYFEERALERNGRTIGVLQPGLSAAHFFGTIPILPYKMGAQPEARPVYTGDGIDPPSDHLTIRQRVRGVMAEAGVILGLNYALP